MITSSLTLIPFKKEPFTIDLVENNGHKISIDRIFEHCIEDKTTAIFSDLSYEFVLNYPNISNICDVHTYIYI